MRDYAQADETPAPEAEDRAVGVASVPDAHETTEAQEPAEYPAESEAPAAHEAWMPTQRTDADEPDADEPLAAEAPADEVSADEAARAEEALAEDTSDEDSLDVDAGDDSASVDDAGDVDASVDDASGVEARDDVVAPEDAPVPAIAYEIAGERTMADDDVTHDELMPGDVPEQQLSGLFDESVAGGFRDRWQRVQLQFVDNPKSAADQARSLVDDVFTAAREALDRQRGALDDWQSGESGQPDDTERLRVAVRGYRDFLDRMLGL
jgi:hypothetical protein